MREARRSHTAGHAKYSVWQQASRSMTSSAIASELGSSRARGSRHGRKRLGDDDRSGESNGDSDHLKSSASPVSSRPRARGGRHRRNRLKEVDRGDESDGDSDLLKSSVSSRPVIDSPHTEDPVLRMEEWEGLGVPSPILRALRDLGFMSPTEIQRRAIPPAITEGCDIIGAAETVRGLLLYPTLCDKKSDV